MIRHPIEEDACACNDVSENYVINCGAALLVCTAVAAIAAGLIGGPLMAILSIPGVLAIYYAFTLTA
jgi:hypothetical protein